MSETVQRTADPKDGLFVRYFYRREPLVMGEGFTYAEVCVGGRLIQVGDADFTVEEAVQLRAWLNSVLPL